ncbi:MAG: hypothetical protein JJE25_04095 [Bacteroidia bacterium]|nr:hypothetical protein [Bacteroidia bacterium]
MKSTNINTVIENFDSLLFEEKEFAVDIINKMYAEEARKAIAAQARKAADNVKKGKVKKGTISDLYKDLEND